MLSSSAARPFSRRRAGASGVVSSIRHLPSVARMPVAAVASMTASVSCTVSIVRIDVVPLRSSSRQASRAAARSEAGVCAASIGQMRVRSQSIRRRSSAYPRNSVWQRWMCVWTKPGSRKCCRGIDGRVVKGGGLRADRRDPPVADGHRSVDHLHPVVHRQDGGVADEVSRTPISSARLPSAC